MDKTFLLKKGGKGKKNKIVKLFAAVKRTTNKKRRILHEVICRSSTPDAKQIFDLID